MNEYKEEIRERLEEYLSMNGVDYEKPFRCFNPDHTDEHPSMSLDKKRHKVHCFACGADYDVFDLIGLHFGLASWGEKYEKALEYFYIAKPDPNKLAKRKVARKQTEGFVEYLEKVRNNINKTDYPQKRGLSEQIVRKFGLGFDERFKHGTGKTWKALIIPTGESSFTARNTDFNASKDDRIRKHGKSCIFNLVGGLNDAVTSKRSVFLTEGEIDALSVIEVGGIALGLGSISNNGQFLAYLKDKKDKKQRLPKILLALDNDQMGKEATDNLLQKLKIIGVATQKVNISEGYNDPNEALIANRETFASAVRQAEAEADEERKKYIEGNVGAKLVDFVGKISASVDTPFIPTGFPRLDKLLDDGLYEGLYIIGAITSLGKTTFIMQVADQIAQTGQDVLIFSLEMATSELMAKSISRLTLLNCIGNRLDTKNAKTCRGITVGKRYSLYSASEHDVINSALNEYYLYAKHIYITEGIGNIGTEAVRKEVEKHFLFTGNRPVVVIDYLQILSPYNDRGTERQNIDRNVLELKRISRDFKIPVLGISSFNRQNYNSPVTLEAFKESGSIEYSSDVLIGLQLRGVEDKDFDVDEAKRKNPREVEFKVLKNRNGAIGYKIPYSYYPLFNYFKEGDV